MNVGFSGASRRSASENYWVGTFSTGTMGSFQPELTRRLRITAVTSRSHPKASAWQYTGYDHFPRKPGVFALCQMLLAGHAVSPRKTFSTRPFPAILPDGDSRAALAKLVDRIE